MVARLVPILLIAAFVAGCNDAPPREELSNDEQSVAVRTMNEKESGTLAIGNCDAQTNACGLNIGDPRQPGRAGNIVHIHLDKASGEVLEATATLTWTPSSPTTERLVLRASALRNCNDGCATDKILLQVEGTSPLTIAIEDVVIPDDLVLGFTAVRSEFMGSGQRVSLLQDFTLEAQAKVVVAAMPMASASINS
jgi:hypothetical protein